MMPYNPRFYEGLLLGAGLEPAEDLLAWWLDAHDPSRYDRPWRIVDRARARHGWTIRALDERRFDAELEILRGVYNSAWEANWGFVPMTAEEFAFSAADLRRIVIPDLVLVAEREGRPVGFALSVPDFNRVLRRLGGSLLPFGWLKALWYGRRIDSARTLALGVVPEVRGQGIEAGLWLETIRRAARHGIPQGECSWTLERNTAIHRVMESMGARPYRRYRLFRGVVPGPVGKTDSGGSQRPLTGQGATE